MTQDEWNEGSYRITQQRQAVEGQMHALNVSWGQRLQAVVDGRAVAADESQALASQCAALNNAIAALEAMMTGFLLGVTPGTMPGAARAPVDTAP